MDGMFKGLDLEDHWQNILVLDKRLLQFAWESIPVLRKQRVCRLPSINFLRDRLLNVKQSDFHGDALLHPGNDVFYVLNPNGDLVNTEKLFASVLDSSWSGVVGESPSQEQFRVALEEQDIFMYFGHSSGQRFFKSSRIKELTKCAVSFLFGCSSGKLQRLGDYDPLGAPVDYLIAGRLVTHYHSSIIMILVQRLSQICGTLQIVTWTDFHSV